MNVSVRQRRAAKCGTGRLAVHRRSTQIRSLQRSDLFAHHARLGQRASRALGERARSPSEALVGLDTRMGLTANRAANQRDYQHGQL